MPSDALYRCPIKISGLFVIAACSLWAFAASGFECPKAKAAATGDSIQKSTPQSQRLSNLLESGNFENRIGSIVAGLRQRRPGSSG